MTFVWASSSQKDVSTEENISTVETVSFCPYKGLAAWLMSGIYVNSSSYRYLFLPFLKFFLQWHNRNPSKNRKLLGVVSNYSLAFLDITLCKPQILVLCLGAKWGVIPPLLAARTGGCMCPDKNCCTSFNQPAPSQLFLLVDCKTRLNPPKCSPKNDIVLVFHSHLQVFLWVFVYLFVLHIPNPIFLLLNVVHFEEALSSVHIFS